MTGGADLKVVFMGTPDFAVPSLREIFKNPAFQVAGVVTQPDRPKGRGNKLTAPPVKKAALELGVEVYQPKSVNTPEAYTKLVEWKPDLIAVVAFGQILKPNVLELPPLGCINVHASLLPKYRGAAPIQWAIINGETKTGVTTMFMEQGLDTGDIILQEELEILPEETSGELHDRLAVMGSHLLLRTLQLLAEGAALRRPQEDSEASYCPTIKREHEVIHWDKSAVQVVNHIRGLNPWPGSYTTLEEKTVKIWRASVSDRNGNMAEDAVPGQVVNVENKGIIVQTGKGQIVIEELQLQNRSRMSAEEFLRGNSIQPGKVLGGASPDHGYKG